MDSKVLGLRIWITTIRFYWIWTWKYLNCDLGLWLIFYASGEVWGLSWLIKDSTKNSSVCGLNTSGRKVELVARAFPAFKLKMNIYNSFLWGGPVTYKRPSSLWNKVIFQKHRNLLYICLLSFGITVKMTDFLSIISRV